MGQHLGKQAEGQELYAHDDGAHGKQQERPDMQGTGYRPLNAEPAREPARR